MVMATAIQQRLAKAVLNEQTLKRSEASTCFKLLQTKLGQECENNETLTSTEIKTHLEDAIDSTEPKQKLNRRAYCKHGID